MRYKREPEPFAFPLFAAVAEKMIASIAGPIRDAIAAFVAALPPHQRATLRRRSAYHDARITGRRRVR